MLKKWSIAEKISPDFENRFPEINPVLLQLLYNRGLREQEQIDEFLNPDYSQDLHNPFLFREMKKAIKRIFKALEEEERIVIHGDYDADGVCGAAVLVKVLERLISQGSPSLLTRTEWLGSGDPSLPKSEDPSLPELRSTYPMGSPRSPDLGLRSSLGSPSPLVRASAEVRGPQPTQIRGPQPTRCLLDVYLPHREEEGYGLNKDTVEKLAKQGTKLIITVDCGISNQEEVALAGKLGMDVIITDHHHPPQNLPKAYAICNPKKEGEKYPFKDLAGVGVAFKLAQALLDNPRTSLGSPRSPDLGLGSSLGSPRSPDLGLGSEDPSLPGQNPSLKDQRSNEAFEKWLLDLVAIGTVTDCSPLLGENRTLVKYGLIVLNKTRRIGLKELMKVAATQSVNTWSISYQIGPRLNAAGRINHANTAYRLLITESFKEAQKLAQELNKTNQERQSLTDRIVEEVKKQIGEVGQEQKILFALGKAWPIGIIGLVAGKISEEFYRPTLVMTYLPSPSPLTDSPSPLVRASAEVRGPQPTQIKESQPSPKNIIIHGSGRSIPEFDLIKALEKTSRCLSRYGGHARACGFVIRKEENYLKFKEELEKLAQEKLKGLNLTPTIEADKKTSLREITGSLYEDLEKLTPFGEGNPEPLFLLDNLEVTGFEKVGSDNQHLRLRVNQADISNRKLIAFNQRGWADRLKIGDKIDVVLKVEEREWNGMRELQLKVVDLRKSESFSFSRLYPSPLF